ncbi:MAG: trypsin-like peptidase domain-containing protein [Planctomycetota bacterium]
MLKPSDDSHACPDTFLKNARELPASLHLRIARRRARAAGLQETAPAIVANESVSTEIESITEALERIHLQPDFLPARFLKDGSQCARAVCRIMGPGWSGTAFLIARGLLITNNHVIRDAEVAAKFQADFDFEDGESKRRVAVRPDKVFITNPDLDYTIVACDDETLTDIVPIPLKRDPTLVAERERVNIIQHPEARKKEVAIHENRVVKRLDRVIHYRTDSERGSSGAPVFNNQWELVALHHAGCNLPNNEALNEGVLISVIVDDLNSKLKDAQFASSAQLVVPHLENASPLLGVFHLSGIVADPANADVGIYAGDRRFTDIGFWCLNEFEQAVTDQRVKSVADAIRTLNLDLLGLTGVETGAIEKVIEQSRAHSTALDYLITKSTKGPNLALLFDTDSTTARRLELLPSTLQAEVGGRPVFAHPPLIARFKVREIDGDTTEFIVVAVSLDSAQSANRHCRQRAAEILVETIDQLRKDHGLPIVLGGEFHQEVSSNVLGAIRNQDDLVFATVQKSDPDSGPSDRSATSLVVGRKAQIEDIVTTRDQQVSNVDGGETGVTRLDQSLPEFPASVFDQTPMVFRVIMHQSECPNPSSGDDEASTVEPHVIRVPAGTKEIRIVFE